MSENAMTRRSLLAAGLGACLALAGCQSGPSSSAPSRTAEEERAAAVERRVDLLESALKERDNAARLMDALGAALPERVWLTEVAYGNGEARVKGIARSRVLFIDYLSSLERNAELAEVSLRSSAQRSARDRETQEFELRAVLAIETGEVSRPSGSAEARLENLEKLLPGCDETSEFFRQFQRLASDAGLQMTKFAPAGAVPGEPYEEWAAAIEVMGGQAALRRFLGGVADWPHLWVVEKFSFKALAADDSRSPVRAAIEVRTLLRD